MTLQPGPGHAAAPHADIPLAEATFVVLDVETTGGGLDDGGITEVGAVKVRGGEHIGQFRTLVKPGGSIVPVVSALTGISDDMVVTAPSVAAVLPMLLEFLNGATLVAHNAPFDVGVLQAACAHHGYRWPDLAIVDTLALARRLLSRDEVANHQLATLAEHFRTTVRPGHRAFDDALATVEVLHALLERLAGHRVFTLGAAIEFSKGTSHIPKARRGKRHLADGLPDAPGAFVFYDRDRTPLYIGASNSVARRVAEFFAGTEKHRRISDMIGYADGVHAIECAHVLEAQVRALRLVHKYLPVYNNLPADDRGSDVGAAHSDRDSLATLSELVAACWQPPGGWEIAVIRHGRLAGAALSPSGVDPRLTVAALLGRADAARHADAAGRADLAGHAEAAGDAVGHAETDLLLRWLDQPEVRLVECAEGWACPVRRPPTG